MVFFPAGSLLLYFSLLQELLLFLHKVKLSLKLELYKGWIQIRNKILTIHLDMLRLLFNRNLARMLKLKQLSNNQAVIVYNRLQLFNNKDFWKMNTFNVRNTQLHGKLKDLYLHSLIPNNLSITIFLKLSVMQ